MNIEIGEYVRTKQGDISKVRYVDEENIFLEDDVWSINDLYEKTNVLYFDDEEIVKHSKNIIDLIEVGDLIKYNSNNSGVDVIEEVLGTCKVDEDYDKGKGFVCTMLDDYIWSNDIKSIVTEQQFSNMEYRV